MNPLHREGGWPASQGGNPSGSPDGQAHPQALRPLGSLSNPSPSQPSAQGSQQPGAPMLPHPSGSFFSGQSSGPSLPHIAGLTQGSQAPLSQHSQALPSMQTVPGESNLPRPLGEGSEVDRGRGVHEQRDLDQSRLADIRMRDADGQARETHDATRLDAVATQAHAQSHESHSGSVPLHQPVAVAPVRSIHGPNGILGGGAAPPVNGPTSLNASLGTPSGPTNIFASGTYGNPSEPAQPRQQAAPQPQGQPAAGGSFPPAAGQASAVGQGQQPILNDALSYLDQVKVQFSERPDVYNKFLDIMKDFKSAQIDTPGVIDRVSNLFAGNPALIQGFNTFLPPGYKIECGAEDDPNAIRVTTPMGTTNLQLPSRPLSNPRPVGGPMAANGQQTQAMGYQVNPYRGPEPAWLARSGPEGNDAAGLDRREPGAFAGMQQTSSGPLSPEMARQQQLAGSNASLMHQQEQRGVSQLQNAASVASIPPNAMPQVVGIEKRGPVEFNHAISYVNKIKNRFAAQPDIYKQFLEILQTYQRESKPIQEVYGQVTTLFATAPDLLEDFKQFLPESAAHAKALAQNREEQAMLSNARGEPGYVQGAQQMQTPRPDQSRMPPVGNFAPTPTSGRGDNKRKRGERAPTGQASSAMAPAVGGDAAAQSGRGVYGQGGSLNKRHKQAHGGKTTVMTDAPPVSPTLVPALPAPLPPTTSVAPSPEEMQFFDRVKKHLGSKSSMNEFLKVCELFTSQLISKTEFVRRLHVFIGANPELMGWFKAWTGYKDEDEVIENKPRQPSGRVALTSCRAYGPSYRLLPEREQLAVCSGRDELCKAVLNDRWASHPTWASEDSGFVAHRKNIHEEGLHRIEEERHDYDFNIETAARLIQLLEPIAQSLLYMSPEERIAYRLAPTLGGSSEAIPKRVIMKIYGRERGGAVYARLFEAPYQCVPIVLNRVKTIIEEWKAAQREWDKVWRKQTQILFWKSLDHQSAGAKNADKRQFQTKTLQNEITVKHQEQKEKRLRGIPTESFQFTFKVEKISVLLDAAALVLTYIQHSNTTEMAPLEDFFKDFISTFFGFDRAEVEQALDLPYNSPDSSDEADAGTPGGADGAGPKVNGRGNSLRQAVLQRGRLAQLLQADADQSVASGSRATTPGASSILEGDIGDRMDVADEDAGADPQLEKWLEHPLGGNLLRDRPIEPNEAFSRTEFHMYCNLPIYCFVRMLLILYERLYNLYNAESEVAANIQRAMAVKPAAKLNMIDKFPNDFFDDVSPTANYYTQVLSTLQAMIRGETDMAFVEELLRRYYLHVGWQLYSVDKLLSSLARFAISIKSGESKDKTWDIWMHFRKDRVRPETTYEDELSYRKRVEKDIKEGEMYRVTYDQTTRKIYIRILQRDDPTFNLSELDEIQLWATYVNSFTSVAPTEGVPFDRVRVPFLRRSAPEPDDLEDAMDELRAAEKLAARISPDTYKPSFTPDLADWVVHARAEAQEGEPIAPADGAAADADAAPAAAREKDAAERIRAQSDEREERVAEKLLTNSPWMRGMSDADVEATKKQYADVKDGSPTEGESMDVDGVKA